MVVNTLKNTYRKTQTIERTAHENDACTCMYCIHVVHPSADLF